MLEVYNADATDALPALLDAEIAATITDPPYSPRVHSKATSAGSNGRGVRKRDLGFSPLTPELRQTIATLIDHTRRWSCVFSDLEGAGDWRAAVEGPDYIRTVPWIRWSQPQMTGDRPPSGAELVTIWHARGRKHWSGPGSLTAFASEELAPGGHFDSKSLRGSDKHSCEKPLDLMLSLVSWFSDPGELVCDPCCGVGTTGLACRLLGRDAVLLDASADACRVAEQRCSSPLPARDAERARRWVESQQAWLTGALPDSGLGQERYQRAAADMQRVLDLTGGHA